MPDVIERPWGDDDSARIRLSPDLGREAAAAPALDETATLIRAASPATPMGRA